jgi:hypothetical protein
VRSMVAKAVEASGFVSSNHRLDVDAYAFRQRKYDISSIPGGLLRIAAKSQFFGGRPKTPLDLQMLGRKTQLLRNVFRLGVVAVQAQLIWRSLLERR